MPDQNPPADAALELFCGKCGYSLHGLPRPICPECGEDATPHLSGVSEIPWLRVRSWLHPIVFWKTVFQISFRDPRRLRFALLRVIDYRHARAFAWLAALHGWAGLLVAGACLLGRDVLLEVHSFSWWSTEEKVGMPAIALALTLIAMLGLSGVQTYFFHDRKAPVGQNERAVALSYFSAAPLALLPLSVAPLAAIGYLASVNWIALASILAGILILLLWYRTTVAFARHILRNSRRIWLVRLGWPLAGITLLLAVLGLTPVLVLFTWFAIRNLFE